MPHTPGRPNGTVQVLAFYVTTDALPYALAWTKLARRIASTIAPGRGSIDLKAGDRMIEQDAYRFIFNVREGEAYSEAVRQLVRDSVLGALSNGFDVILEGILSVRGYRDVFATLFREHPRNNHLFYLQVSFEETVRRHAGRAKAPLFDDADMRRWYKPGDLLGYDFERVIDEGSSLDRTVELIRSAITATAE